MAAGGAALIIDYGHAKSAVGDTFQAVRRHRYASPLALPGLTDLTAHVDFEALARAAEAAGARIHGPVEQGTLLKAARHRGARSHPHRERAARGTGARSRPRLQRLIGTGPGGMGALFKALGLSAPQVPEIAGICAMTGHDASERCSSSAVSGTLFSRARGGVSTGIYASSTQASARMICRKMLPATGTAWRRHSGVRPDHLLTCYQVHSADVVIADRPWTGNARPRADAIATRTPGLAIGVSTADCGPVLFADPRARVIAAAHAGWRGALAGVTDQAIAAMERLGAERSRIVAAIGPMIRQPNYETGADLVDRFVAADGDNARFFKPSARNGHAMFDLAGYIAARLAGAGIAAVEDIGACTYADPDRFYSYRRMVHRNEPDYGRHVNVIVLDQRGVGSA